MRLVINDGKIEYAGNPLIEHINFDINENSKIAIIGKNGSGKTSLLKVIDGSLDLVFDNSNKEGYINKSNDFSIGYLKQISFSNENNTLENEILECYLHILEQQKKVELLQKELEKNPSEKNILEYSLAYEMFENMDGYYYQKEYNTVLKKFGFNSNDLSKKINEFSGGERTKIAFIKLLLSKPDLLLLDEPTNHLDVEAIEWLEDYLKNYKKAFIVVSHDREFINKVTKTIYEIEFNTITKYSGNYNDYLVQKETNYRSIEKQYNEQQKQLKHEQELIDRFRYKATKAKMVQSRIKQLDKLEIIEPPKSSNNKKFKMNINPLTESGKDVIIIEDLKIGYDKELSIINLIVHKGDKIGIIGENGTGKSTFLKTINNIIKPLSGEYKYGFNVKVGYFDQQIASKVNNNTILEEYTNTYPNLTNQEARNDLGAFLFSGDDVNKQLLTLSGGEVVRLGLCKLFKKRPNFLILDEPTNHMDIYSKEAIEKMLKEYKGTLLFVSHDRYFIRKVATSLLVFENQKVVYYPCGYEQYLENKSSKKEIVKVNEIRKEVKINSNDKNTLKKELNMLEKEIKKHEDEIQKLNEEFDKEEVYQDFLLTREIEEKIEELDDELQILLRNWEELLIKIEQ